MFILAAAAVPVRKMTFVSVYLNAGLAGHLSTLLFFGGLVLAWRIHRKGLGLRHRLVLVLVAFLPLLVGIYDAAHGFIIQTRAISQPSPLGDFASPSSRLGAIPVGAFECLVLLGVSSLLLLSKRAETGRDA